MFVSDKMPLRDPFGNVKDAPLDSVRTLKMVLADLDNGTDDAHVCFMGT